METTDMKYGISDDVWAKIEPFTIGMKGTWGGNAKNNRQFVGGVFWVLKHGVVWRDLPAEYGGWSNANKRFNSWRDRGIWEKMLEVLVSFPEFAWLVTDRTQNEVHSSVAGSKQKHVRRGRPKSESAERYRWAWLRMICGSEHLLQKLPQLHALLNAHQDASFPDENLLSTEVPEKTVEEKKRLKNKKLDKNDAMSKVSYRVTLAQEEREELEQICTTGKHGSQKVLNAIILLRTDEGEFQENKLTASELAKVLPISTRKVDRVKQRFVEHGIEFALNKQKPDRIFEKKIDGDLEAHLIALACSSPPSGYAKWTLRLLAEKFVELEYVDSISYETVRRALKKTPCPHGKSDTG